MLTGITAAHAQSPTQPWPADIERLRVLVEAGAAPRAALEKAQNSILDQKDDQILRRTLYGPMRLEDVTDEDVAEMMGAAERRVERLEKRLAELAPLVKDGIYAPSSLVPFQEDLAERRRTVELARSRAAFIRELAEMARAEEAVQNAPLSTAVEKPVWVRFDGKATFGAEQLKVITQGFEKKFGRVLPVSAYGETAYHRSLGFDHRGRMDVALNPDSPEGMWFKWFLEMNQISFFAFRSAKAGSASGAHFHVGPPSLRLRLAD